MYPRSQYIDGKNTWPVMVSSGLPKCRVFSMDRYIIYVYMYYYVFIHERTSFVLDINGNDMKAKDSSIFIGLDGASGGKPNFTSAAVCLKQ